MMRVLTANAEKAKRVVARLAHDFPHEHEPCPIGSDRALDNAMITAPEARDPALMAKLDAVAGRPVSARWPAAGHRASPTQSNHPNPPPPRLLPPTPSHGH